MPGNPLPNVVWVLMLVQALSMSVAPLFFFSGGIVGNDIAPRAGLATLPVAMVILGTALSIMMVTRLMQALGRKRVFLGGAAVGIVAALLAAVALSMEHFVLFCLAGVLAGISIAVAQQYRFAAIEAVPPTQAGRATSRVLLGGLISAYIGPELVVWGAAVTDSIGLQARNEIHGAFIGGFGLLALVCAAVLSIMAVAYRNRAPDPAEQTSEGRPLRQILRNPMIWLAIIASAMGYAMMSFMMTATPLNMHAVDGHSLLDTKWVIQSHIVAMFAPSFFSGWLISRLGHRRVIVLGVLAYCICLGVALAGHQLLHYWWALVLLGIGWNFMFVAGTALLPACHRPEERFKVQTANEFSVFGTQAVAALSSGWVVNTYGWDTLVGLSFVMVVVVVLGLLLSRGSPQPTVAPSV